MLDISVMRPKYDLGLLDKLIGRGLCHGYGDGKTTVCVEQAVALCAGLPLSDNPSSCTAPAVRDFGLRLNDRRWSSAASRANGLRAFAFAQLGTAGRLDEGRFSKRVAELVIRELVPIAFRAVAKMPKLAAHREALEAAALKCEVDGTEASAREARKIAAAAAGYAAAACAAASYAAAAAAASYAAAAADRSRTRDEMLSHCAGIAVRAIHEQMGDDMILPPVQP